MMGALVPIALFLAPLDDHAMTSLTDPGPTNPGAFAAPKPGGPLAALVDAETEAEQIAGASAVWSTCFGLHLALRDAETGTPVGFGSDWAERAKALTVEVTCEGQRGTFRPLSAEPVFILMRE